MISPKLYSQKEKGDFDLPLQHHKFHAKRKIIPVI
jgi:hypothetical protein